VRYFAEQTFVSDSAAAAGQNPDEPRGMHSDVKSGRFYSRSQTTEKDYRFCRSDLVRLVVEQRSIVVDVCYRDVHQD